MTKLADLVLYCRCVRDGLINECVVCVNNLQGEFLVMILTSPVYYTIKMYEKHFRSCIQFETNNPYIKY